MGDSSHLKFCFELDGVEDIPPWGDAEDRKLHWFGLTSGHYWITTPLGELLRYTDERAKMWNCLSPYVDYQVARLFEDLQEQLPRVLESVPPDVALIVSDPEWYARAERWWNAGMDGDGRWDVWYQATEWWHQRELDTSYLINGPSVHMWRTDDEILVRWQATGEKTERVWATPDGQFAVNAASFESAAYTFFERVLGLMRERVEIIQARGWTRKDCRLDIPLLLKEQRHRTTWVNELKGRRTQTDWDNVRSFLDRLSSEMQS